MDIIAFFVFFLMGAVAGGLAVWGHYLWVVRDLQDTCHSHVAEIKTMDQIIQERDRSIRALKGWGTRRVA